MKKCIWCSKSEPKVDFKKLAHTIPQTLGGKNICENVCDECNSFFGNYHNKIPAIETVLKETFNISRARFLQSENEIGKNKSLPKFSSIYFNVDFNKNKMSLKPAYKFHPNFQENMSRQLKKGIYKIFLEEKERQHRDGHLEKYDFIREFCRYDLGDYPVFYFERTHGLILMVKSWAKSPELFFEEEQQFKYLVNEPCFFEFELLGHVFGIVTSRNWEFAFDNYIKKSGEAKKDIFKTMKSVRNFSDIDLTLNILNESKGSR